MKKNLSIMATVCGLMFSINSFAGVVIEPLGGFNWITDIQGDSGVGHYNWGGGWGYGAKLGYFTDKKHGWSGGLSYLNTDSNMSNNDFDRNFQTTEWGAYASYKLPALFKFYGELIFSAEGNTKINDREFSNESGWGWKVGAGTTILPFIDLNMDYRKVYFSHMDYNAFFFSASWPIHFFE